MNENDQKELEYIRSLSSTDAATFIIERYDDAWPVLISHRSWEKADQLRLAQKFIQGRVHATDRGYKDFLSFMSIEAFIKTVEDGLQDIAPERLDLLSYYLMPSLRSVAKTQRQIARVETFAKRLSELQP